MSSTQYVDVESYLRRLDDGNLHPTNVDAIRTFIDHCAAEGISEVRQERLASALKSILVNLAPNAFQLTNASEQEIKRVVAALNRSDYAQSTKHTFRSALKKFYKVENGGHKEPGKNEVLCSREARIDSLTRRYLHKRRIEGVAPQFLQYS